MINARALSLCLFLICLFASVREARAEDAGPTCNTWETLRFQGGGAIASTGSPGICRNLDIPPITGYIGDPPFSSPAPWAGLVSGACDGSQPNPPNIVSWQNAYWCHEHHDYCMDALINGTLSVEAATIPKWCDPKPLPDNTCCTGHPIRPGEGEKVFAETDFSFGALQLTRHYNSFGPRSNMIVPPGLFGQVWRSNYDRSVYPVTGDTTGIVAMAVRPDSRVKYFNSAGQETEHYNGTPAETLVSSGSGWTYTTGRDEVETYDSSGRLIALWDKNNLQQTLSYDSQGRLSQVMDAHGRSITFTYTGDIYGLNGGTVTATAPDNTAIVYAVSGTGNLTAITYPGGATRRYTYASPTLLNAVTLITDENGTPYEGVEYNDANSGSAPSPTFGYATASYLAPGVSGNSIGRNSFVYNSDGTTSHTDPLGATQTITFSTPNGVLNIAGLSSPCASCNTGNVQSWTYDGAGYLQSTIDFNHNATSYTFDDARGLETSRVEVSGKSEQRTTNTTWNPGFHVPDRRAISNLSCTVESLTTWAYNGRGQATARCRVDPSNSTASSYVCGSATNAPAGVRQWTYTYCDSVGTGCPLVGLLRSVNGPRTDVADITTYAYYTATDLSGCTTLGGACHGIGDLQSVTNALGQVTTYVSYDKNGRITRLKDANGVYIDMTYHPRGWLLTRTVRANSNGTPNSTLDATMTFSYDNVGNVTRVTQPDNSFLSYTYDAAHRLTDITDSAGAATGNTIHFTLDAAGNRVDEQTKDSNGVLRRELSRTYDQLNRLTALLNSSAAPVQSYTNPSDAPPAGISYTDGYDGNGNPIYSIDGTTNHVGTEQQYDPLNRLAKSLQDHAGSGATRDTTTRYAYDTRDNLRSVTDPDGLVTAYTYDGINNLTDLTSPDTGHSSYTYDAVGNRSTQTDALGITSTYGYDALNRLTSISYPTASLNITYSYDQVSAGCYNVGRLTTITDHAGTTAYCYDLRGNVLKKTQTTADLSLSLGTLYQYNLADRLTTVTYPSGMSVTYIRDRVGRVASVTYKNSATTSAANLITALTYYPFGPQNVLTFANGRTLTKTYDGNYAIDKIVSSNASGLIVDGTVDVLGNLVDASGTVGASPPTQQYQYDPLYRLTNIQNGVGASLESFTYGPTVELHGKLSHLLQ